MAADHPGAEVDGPLTVLCRMGGAVSWLSGVVRAPLLSVPYLTAGGLQLQARRGCKPSGQGWVGQVVWIAWAGQKGAFPERLGNHHKRGSWTSPTIKNDFRKGSS